ncbi:T9SS type A sorting domain-containing protein [Rosettibacter firmus]|uniref:T9SS type A sorting domain-containing protein n=1 Tax=Rosettibacter firmus TaxID=3111522 RepID=UPI00336C0F5A
MKKLLIIFIILFSITLFAQEAYWTENFDDAPTDVVRSSPGPLTPTPYTLTYSGEWIFLGVYLGGSSSYMCSTSAQNPRTLRMPKTTTVQSAGIEPPCYAITPKLNSGVGKVIFKEGRGDSKRIVAVYKSNDDGQTWELVGKTEQGTVKCEDNVFEVNDANTNRIKFANVSETGDVDIDEVTITKATGTDLNETVLIPSEFYLEQNYPNPFNPSTTISFSIPKSSFVNLSIYNSLGQKVSTLISKEMNAGYHSILLDASNLTSGVYFYKLTADNFVSVKKMILAK